MCGVQSDAAALVFCYCRRQQPMIQLLMTLIAPRELGSLDGELRG
jgi:hypothetical protein